MADGDGPAEAGLAHARRAHEAEDRPLDVGLHLADGQVLEDALLDLLQVVVVVVQDLLGLDEVDLGLRALAPGQRHQPVEVGAGDGVLGGGRGHLGRGGPARAGPPSWPPPACPPSRSSRELVVLALLVVAVAQLLLDGLHLLAQVVLALVLLELGLDLALDLVADLQHLEVLDQHLVEPLEAALARRGSPASPASARCSARAGCPR